MTMKEDGKEKKKTACVTGGNGFLASALVKLLLEQGYAVHATVRDTSAEKVAHLAALQSLGDLRIFQADLDAEGSFDEAVNGCDFAFLVASPVVIEAPDPEKEIIQPAIKGTLNVLRSCSKAKTVRRVVLTSSAAAVSANQLEGPELALNEDSWTDIDFLRSTKPPSWGYLAAKTLAEKAAWKFADDNHLNLISVNPSLIIGPSLTVDTPFSLRLALALISGEKLPTMGLTIMDKVSGSISFVHVEDVCRAQLYLAETDAAAGRYIVSAIDSGLSALQDFLFSTYPQYKINTSLADVPLKPRVRLSSEKLVKEGFTFKHKNLKELYDLAVEMGTAARLLQKATDP